MIIPTAPIGSIPCPPQLVAALDAGHPDQAQRERLFAAAPRALDHAGLRPALIALLAGRKVPGRNLEGRP